MQREISAFLALADGKAGRNDLDALSHALDDLVMAYNRSSETFDATETEAPPRDYKALYAAASRAFPEFGYYPDVDPRGSVDSKPLLADAIDDIADIAGDLHEVLWRLENVGFDDANWHFRFLYGAHWGVHLHRLRVYLHAKLHR